MNGMLLDKIFRLQKRLFCHFVAEKNCETVQLSGCLDISIWFNVNSLWL